MAWSQPYGGGGSASTPVGFGGTWSPAVQNFNDAFKLAQSGAAPQFAQYQNNYNSGMRNMGDQYYSGQLDSTGLGLQYQGNLNDLNSQMGSNAVQLAGANRDAALYGSLIPLQNQTYENQAATLGLQHASDRATLLSQMTGQGAVTSKGNRQQENFMDQNLMYGTQAADLNRQMSNVTHEIRMGNAQDTAKQLAIEAQNLGTKPELLQAQLQNALAKTGLSTKMNVDQLMDGLAKNNLDSVNLYNQLIQWSQGVANAAGK